MRFNQILAYQEDSDGGHSLVALDEYGKLWQRVWLYNEPAHRGRYVWKKLSMETYPEETNTTEEHKPWTVGVSYRTVRGPLSQRHPQETTETVAPDPRTVEPGYDRV